MKKIRVFSSGGGVQSTAVLVLQAQGKLNYDVHVFANVGFDTENPDTLLYVQNVIRPYALEHGVQFVEVEKRRKDGSVETLYQYINRLDLSVPIPAYLGSGMPGRRACTGDWKVRVIQRFLRREYGVGRGVGAVVGLGISVDEYQRMRTSVDDLFVDEYPLIDLRISRFDCERIVREAGLPIPPKSSCFFCPFHSGMGWYDLRRRHPDLFELACQLEKNIQEKRLAAGRDRVWLHHSLKPLESVVSDQEPLFELDAPCESGYCMV